MPSDRVLFSQIKFLPSGLYKTHLRGSSFRFLMKVTKLFSLRKGLEGEKNS